jgi:dipeptidyl aminopeptidase/acylaminoacyl peptidase
MAIVAKGGGMSRFKFGGCFSRQSLLVAVCVTVGVGGIVEAGEGLSFEQLAAVRSVDEVVVAPGGSFIAYTLDVPRKPGDDPDGAAWRELHVVSVEGGADASYISGEVKVSSIRFSPDGQLITYLAERDGDPHTSLWAIPLSGGESRRLLAFETAITDYRVSPDGKRVAFVAREPECKERKARQAAGYSQEIFEEDWLPKRVWLAPLPSYEPPAVEPGVPVEDPKPKALEIDGSPYHVRFSPDGGSLAVDVAPRPLVDDDLMLRRVTIVDSDSGEVRTRFDNPGKLGAFDFGPDGKNVAMISAADPNDPAQGRLMVAPAGGGPLRDVLPDLEGHVAAFAWQDANTLMFLSDEREETRFGEVDIESLDRKTHAMSGSVVGGVRTPIMSELSLSSDGERVALVGDSPEHPGEVYTMTVGDAAPRRLTDSNPWLALVELAPQEVFRHEARDGLDLSGVLIRPVGEAEEPAPLLLFVHGGPEGHRRNGWLTRYSAPGQLAAARGYAVFYPNYRGSTGRGVEFSKLGQNDAAGKEFDDVVDAVDALVAAGIADNDRVGVTGGSYGGYATAWLATTYSDRFKAGVMFVGISNKISKGMTTEIPVEDIMVHTRFAPYTNWQFSLERSPLYHAEKCRTPLLIAGGTADSRVHPSQSLQFYRALKLIGETSVRYVRYPGEEHGNRRAASRDDYARRLMRWMDHFVKDGNTELPPWELDGGQGELIEE